MHVPASFSLASARLCLLLPRHLGLGQVLVLLVGTSQPSGVFLLLAARLRDSRQVSDPLWAHTVVNEVMSVSFHRRDAHHLTTPHSGPSRPLWQVPVAGAWLS